MNLNKIGTKLQDTLTNDGRRKLRKLLSSLSFVPDFNNSLLANERDLSRSFIPIVEFMSAYAETVSLTAVEFSKRQLRNIKSKKYSVKQTDVEITVDWTMVEQNVLDYLRNGSDFSNPYFDLFTEAIAVGNRNYLRDEYTAFILGERNLKEAYDHLRHNLVGPQRADLIIRGETTQLWANAQQEAYRSAGTIRNIWNTRNDGPKVCPICQPLNQAVAVIGETFLGTRYTKPAAHLGCRCWLSPDEMTDQEIEDIISGKQKLPPTATLKINK